MGKVRHLFPGGNTCYGFHSFYDYIVNSSVKRKIILKGGPGVGKSSFMQKIAEEFSFLGLAVEYHWCSSDNHSLDAIVIGNQQFCLLDGTAPHIVEPQYPGAVDEIVNLGQFWNRKKITADRETVITLTRNITSCFNRAYLRLKEAKLSWEEWKSYYDDARDNQAVKRNVQALSADFSKGFKPSDKLPRHLFAGAITPAGLVTRVDSIIDKESSIFAVKGSPGSGLQSLFDYVLHLAEWHQVYVEVFHNPFDPENLDIILLPESKFALVDISSYLLPYADFLPAGNYKRFLDFDQLTVSTIIEPQAQLVSAARDRFDSNLKQAISSIQKAKTLHDQLEALYIDAMDFAAVEEYRQDLVETLKSEL